MTLSAASPTELSFATDGVLTRFQLTDLIFRDASDLVGVHVTSAGVETVLSAGAGFSVTGSGLRGAAAFLSQSTLVAGTLTVKRRTPPRQDSALTLSTAVGNAAIEAALDDLARQIGDQAAARAELGGDVAALQVLDDKVQGLLAGISDVPVMASMAALQALGSTFTRPLLLLQSFTAGLRSGAGYWSHDPADSTSLHDGVSVAVDAAGRRWKPIGMPRANRPFEVIDLEYFLSRYSDTAAGHRLALIEAHKALFIDAARTPALLQCHGIQLQIAQPVRLRNDVFAFGASAGKAEKTISDLHVKAIDDGYGWLDGDFIYSIAGLAGSGDLRYFTLDRPVINMNGKNLIGLHVSGYYHVTVNNARVRGLGNSGIGIYSSKYDSLGPGTGKPAGTPTDNGNHGIQIVQPDIRGTFGLSGGSQCGIFLEDGDADVSGGWLSFLDTGIVSRRGGLNTEGVHYSMGDRANMTIGIRVDAPRQCSFTGDEMDGCGILFQNPADNMWTEGTSLSGWQQLSMRGQKFAGRTPGGATAGFGFITFITHTPAEKINTLQINPDWVSLPSASIDVVKFLTSGSGAWDGPNFNRVLLDVPHNNNMDIGTFPAGVRLQIMKSQSHATVFDPADGAIELLAPSNGGEPPFLRATGKELELGRVIAGVKTVRWTVNDAGDLVPTGDGTKDLGTTARRVKDLWLAGAARLPLRTATGAGGAVTLNEFSGTITTETLTTASDATLNYTLTNNKIAAADHVIAWIAGASGTGEPLIGAVIAAAGSAVIRIRNVGGAALNAAVKIGFIVIKAA